MSTTLRSLGSLSAVAGAAACILGLLAACPATVQVGSCPEGSCGADAGPVDNSPPRFFADPPFGVGFSCVEIGCDTEKTLVLENQGGGRLGIALVRPAVDTSFDFTLSRADGAELPRPEAPAFLGPSERLEVVVRYLPSDGVVDTGAVVVEHWDAALPYEESIPLEDQIPLTARAVGAPAAALPQAVLDFGFVAVGETRTLDVVVENRGTEGVLAAGPAAVEGPAPDAASVFHAVADDAWAERFANAGASTSFSVAFTPTGADAFFGALVIATNDPALPSLRVELQGTAIAEPRLAVTEPAGDVVLAPMRLGESRAAPVRVRNLGGQPLELQAAITGAALGFTVAPSSATVAPLAEATFAVSLASVAGGGNEALLTFQSNDPASSSESTRRVVGTVNAPQVQVTPDAVDLGAVVQSWVATPQAVTLTNSGFGELTISGIDFEVGSSQAVQIVDGPMLPVKLPPGDAGVTLTVVMHATSIGPVEATLLVTSDDIDAAVTRVPLSGRVITCDEGCPTARGIPECSTGACRIGSCLDGYHDPNGDVHDGCECSEDLDPFNNRVDIPQACPGRDLGNLYDNANPEEVVVTGTLHTPSDIDLIYFQAIDNSQFLDDSFGVVVKLESGPPGLLVCANIRSSDSGCGGLPTTCSTTSVSDTGSGIGDDSKDVTVFLKWAPDAAPMCGPYTLRLRANAG